MRSWSFALGAVLATVACAARAPRAGAGASSGAEVTAEAGANGAPVEIAALEVPGFSPAVVSVPPFEGRPKPCLVVAHGAWDRPEWHCELWSRIVGVRGYVLCLRGRRTDYRVPHDQAAYYFPEHHYLGRLVRATLAAARREYGERIDVGGAVYVGFSQGSLMGSLVVGAHPRELPRAVFIEGGGEYWNIPIARRYAAGGGKRVAFVCGTGWCSDPARAAVQWLEGVRVDARLVAVPGAGHTTGGEIEARLPEVFEWVTAGDPRWR